MQPFFNCHYVVDSVWETLKYDDSEATDSDYLENCNLCVIPVAKRFWFNANKCLEMECAIYNMS